jgi:thioredoxin 2
MNTTIIDAALIRCQSCTAINRVPVKRLKHNPLCGKCKALLDFPMKPVDATASTLDSELATWPETVLVAFWSKECSASKTADAVMSDIAFLRAGRLKVIKVDFDAEPSLALLHSISATPSFIMLRNRVQIARLDGIPKDKVELIQWVETYLNQ